MNHLRIRDAVTETREIRIQTLIWIVLLVLLAACGPQDPEPLPDTITSVDLSDSLYLLDPCGNGYPDAVFEIPEHKDFPASNSIIRISSQDTYWYGLYHQHHKGCERHVVDIKFNDRSNIDCLPQGPCSYAPVLLSADAYNLPSSNGWHHDGTIPGNPRDCNAYEMQIRFYEKLAGAAYFSFLEEKVFETVWDQESETCFVQPLPGDEASGILESGAGRSAEWDTYRVAVKVLLRGLPQQARVIATPRVPLPG